MGNGGTAGIISYGALAAGLRRGYVTAGRDTGHVSKDSADSSWALGRPDAVADFGYRGLHVMTDYGKKRQASTTRSPPARTRWAGRTAGTNPAFVSSCRLQLRYATATTRDEREKERHQ